MIVRVETDAGRRWVIPIPNGLVCNSLGAHLVSRLSKRGGKDGLSCAQTRALLGSVKNAKAVLNGLPLLEVTDDGTYVRIDL